MTVQAKPSFEQAADLDWYAGGDTISVLGPQQVRIELQKDFAIRVLQIAKEHRDRFERELTLLLGTLSAWVEERRDRVRSAHLTLRDSVFELVIVSASDEYDAEFQDALSKLDLAVAHDRLLENLKFSTMLLPSVSEDGLRSFINERFFFTYRGGATGDAR